MSRRQHRIVPIIPCHGGGGEACLPLRVPPTKGSGPASVMEGHRRIKGAGSWQGKRDGSGKTGTDLNGRHLLGYARRGVVEGKDEGEEEVVLLRTALNGRPRAGVNWGKNGVEGGVIDTFSFAFLFAFAFALSFPLPLPLGGAPMACGNNQKAEAPKDRGGWTAGFCREARVDVESRSGHWVGGTWCQWGAGRGSARRCSRWKMINSATVDDPSIEAYIYEFLRSLRTGEFLSCDTNMGCGMSVMLGNELTTLWEADGTIKKREERRRYKWASGWIGVTSRVGAHSLSQPATVGSKLRVAWDGRCHLKGQGRGGRCTKHCSCDKQPKASLSHWRAIWQISLLRPCEPPGHCKEVPWQMRKIFTFWVQISGSNPFSMSCCMLPVDIMSVAMEKGNGLVVGLWKLWTQRVLLTG